ncbi:hypothetical protein Tco_0332997 [Tanacetum coccineum]
MTDSRLVLEQYNELLDFKHTLKHLKEELTLVELGSHLRIEEFLRVQDSDKPNGNNVVGPSVVNMVEHNNFSRYNDSINSMITQGLILTRRQNLLVGNVAKLVTLKGIAKVLMLATKPMDDDVAWWVDSRATVHVCKDRCWFKTYESMNDGSILHMGNESTALVHGRSCVDLRLNIINDNIAPAFMSTSKLNDSILWHARLGHGLGCRVVIRLHDPKLKTLGERGIECIFVGYAEHFKAFRFSSVLRPNLSIPKGTEDIGGSVVPEKVTKEAIQQPEPELRKSKKNKTPKDFGPEFQLYLIEGTRDESSYYLTCVLPQRNISRQAVVYFVHDLRYGYSSVGRFDVFFRNQLLVFQQHQDESLYDSWTRFKDIIRKVPNHGLSIWTLIEIFLKHLDSLSRHIINLTAEGDLRKFSDIGAWYAIEDCAQYDKKCSNPTSAISDETIANLNAQIVGDDMVRVQVPRCMAWLDYDEHVDSLSTMDNEVGVTSPKSTTQTLLSFEEYTPPVTYSEEV